MHLRDRLLPVHLQSRLLDYRQSNGDLSWPESSSASGIRGRRADRVNPQNFWGDISFLVAVNFQPIWLPQILHWAIVQAYPGNQLCSVDGRPLRFKLQALYTVRVSWMYPWGFTYAAMGPHKDKLNISFLVVISVSWHCLQQRDVHLFMISNSHRSRWTALPILSNCIRNASSIGRQAATL